MSKFNKLDVPKVDVLDDLGKPGLRNYDVCLEDININPQARKYFPEESIKELASSINERGILLPLLLIEKPTGYELVCGERRYRAAKLIGLETVPCRMLPRNLTQEELELIQLYENIQREDLKPMELAEVYKKMQDFYHMSTRSIAEKIKKSHAHVVKILQLLDLPDSIKEKVVTGLPPSKALGISKLNKKTQKEVLKNIDNFTRDDIRKLREKTEPDPFSRPGKSSSLLDIIHESHFLPLNAEDQETDEPIVPENESRRIYLIKMEVEKLSNFFKEYYKKLAGIDDSATKNQKLLEQTTKYLETSINNAVKAMDSLKSIL